MIAGEVRAVRGGDADWVVVVGLRFVAALTSVPDTAADALRSAAGDGAIELEPLIGSIPLGEHGVTSFALAWWPPTGDRLTVVVRGEGAAALATAGGPRRLDARGIRPWHLAEFAGVEAIRLGPAAQARPGAGARRADAAQSEVTRTDPALGAPGLWFRAAGVEWRAPGDPDTELVIGAAGLMPAARAGREASIEDEDEDEDAALEPTHAERAAPRFRVTGGTPREVADAVVIGRRPTAPRIARGDVELVRIERADPAVSATHLELRRAGERLVATDLRSTNGTIVRTPAGARRLRAGESVVVVPGTVLALGGDTIVEILPPVEDRAHPDRQVDA